MPRFVRTLLAPALLLAAARTGAYAQATDPFAYPSTCAEQGISRVALSVPPGRTRADLEASLRAGAVFPPGTEAFIFPDGAGPRVLNAEHLHDRANRMLGATLTRLTIDAEGKVTATAPNTRNGEFDRLLDTLWKEAEFEPVIVHGCRPLVMFHMPVHFESDYSLARRGVRMGWGPRPPAP
jgi:hypothetical protein